MCSSLHNGSCFSICLSASSRETGHSPDSAPGVASQTSRKTEGHDWQRSVITTRSNVMRAITSLAFAFGVIGSFAISDPLQAQSWPQRPVRLIVPLPAGTAVDVSARVFGEHLSAQWKQPVIVENILGVDGVLATKEFAGRADNHTLLYSFAG